ncbi:hypothetical protein ACLMJK_005648 [Lecanora helva]
MLSLGAFLILLPFFALSTPVRRDSAAPRGYGIFKFSNNNFTVAPSKPPRNVIGRLLWTHTPVSDGFEDTKSNDYGLANTTATLSAWLKANNVVIRTQTQDQPSQCVGTACSSASDCTPIYKCLFQALQQTDSQSIVDAYGKCITNDGKGWVPGGNNAWQCLLNLDMNSADPIQRTSCNGQQWALTQKNWRLAKVDTNLQAALEGGTDSDGVFWQGRDANEMFSQAIGRQLWGEQGVQCTLANPCRPALKCEDIGSHTAVSLGTSDVVLKSQWAFLATSAIKNINQQLWNQYNELKDAIESLALDTFNIDDFFPKKGQNFPLLDSLTGLSTIFSILGGFVPVVGEAVSAAGTIASSSATFLSNAVNAARDPLEAQKTFADKVLVIYKALLGGMDAAVTNLFNGDAVGGTDSSFTILDMMKDGVWVNPQTLSNVSDINTKVRREILARSIDSLWKTFSSNKMWVLFVDLGEQDRINTPLCMADTTGPQTFKYCADGGVYYTYNFIEHGDEGGGVGYPWGADQINDKLGIMPQWITEASAKSYRLSKTANSDLFKFDQLKGTQSYLQEAFTTSNNMTDLSQYAGRYPGSWTIPVCDASTWGKGWNWDYTKEVLEYRVDTHPPCFCGPNGQETFAWAQAAGMTGFETFWHRCTKALEKGFAWPNGVTSIQFPTNDGKNYYTVKKKD